MNSEIIKTLKPLNIPVRLRHYDGKETTYITFFEYLNQDEEFAEDTDIMTGRYYQIDIWSKGNYNKIVKETEQLLKDNGWRKRSQNDAPYEADTGYFHKVLRYLKEEE